MADARNTGPTPRRFGFTLGGALLVIAAVLTWRQRTGGAFTAGALGVALVSAGAFAPRALAPVSRAWMALGHALGLIVTPVVFTLFWWLAFVPMGILRRTLSRSPMARDPKASTYWVVRKPVPPDVARSAMERQY
ncbi:MAG TPA: SxtJ family membrane protein [Gemmatimonas sp.]|uniref:SxtJ family membrane protein n=1 Tax=Gemmatimonas sp. TaxID=1962908 RepID=UPI002EDA5607